MIAWYRRRKRLKNHGRLQVGSQLKRYVDPQTGKHYVARSRYSPLMIESIVNELEGKP
jgi:hypothetical protein